MVSVPDMWNMSVKKTVHAQSECQYVADSVRSHMDEIVAWHDFSHCVVDKTSWHECMCGWQDFMTCVVVNALCLEHDMHEKHIFW